jgi:hypothetical protein
LIDEQYIRREFDLPKKENYPNAPSTLFREPSNYIFNNSGFLQSQKNISYLFGTWKCEITSQIIDKPLVSAIGEGPSKVSSLWTFTKELLLITSIECCRKSGLPPCHREASSDRHFKGGLQ